MEIDIQNDLNNKNLEVGKEQKSFLETTLGGIINTGLNLGIKYLLPDFVEDEVIKIKDTILNEGFKEGLNTAIDEAVDLGKSAIGIVTGKFEDISQMQKAVETGGIIDTISKGLDTTINKVNEKGTDILIEKQTSNSEGYMTFMKAVPEYQYYLTVP